MAVVVVVVVVVVELGLAMTGDVDEDECFLSSVPPLLWLVGFPSIGLGNVLPLSPLSLPPSNHLPSVLSLKAQGLVDHALSSQAQRTTANLSTETKVSPSNQPLNLDYVTPCLSHRLSPFRLHHASGFFFRGVHDRAGGRRAQAGCRTGKQTTRQLPPRLDLYIYIYLHQPGNACLVCRMLLRLLLSFLLFL